MVLAKVMLPAPEPVLRATLPLRVAARAKLMLSADVVISPAVETAAVPS